MKKILAIALWALATLTHAQHNERIYLSGRGCDDMKEWDFQVTDGRNAGKWSKIGVPSCWETQGFGSYQYGMAFYGKAFPDGVANEKGLYKTEFTLPEAWRGRQVELIFEAAMTDLEGKINGRKIGSKNQGGFYRVTYDISDRLYYGGKKNLLELTVSKESENASVNLAERRADYWNFGGLIRPVFLQAKPIFNLRLCAIDAQADGSFRAQCQLSKAFDNGKIKLDILDAKGKLVSSTEQPLRSAGDHTTIQLKTNNPQLWSAETPTRYQARFTLLDNNNKPLHEQTEWFGFRTIEVRPSDGLYINGVRVNIRGVNRHSFRPESGRTLSPAKNIEDVLLIKSMNMNSVRLSHYPADPEFLTACDSLGLYVMNELGGWHGRYDTPTGIPLIQSMVERDLNHPSVIWWSNGNEKGWNTELDGEFHKYDIQRRPVLHPQGNFAGFETMHYRSFGESQEYMRLPEIFMPTEFLHGLYDGGHGAGLYDYWEMMRRHPRCIGGFLWVLADEGIVRVDKGGMIDNQGNWGADGIVGPHFEKEGSYYTIRQVWSPVQIMNTTIDRTFDGKLNIENRYDFLNLSTVKFTWQQVTFPKSNDTKGTPRILAKGEARSLNLAPHAAGTLDLNTALQSEADALYVTATDAVGHELFRWAFPLNKKEYIAPTFAAQKANNSTQDTLLQIKKANNTYTFSRQSGMLKQVQIGNRTISLGQGPRFVAARRADRSLDQFYNHDDPNAQKKNRTYTSFNDAARFDGFNIRKEGNREILTAFYHLGNLEKVEWSFLEDGSVDVAYAYNFAGVVDLMGIMFDYPEEKVKSKRWLGDGPFRVWQNRLHGPVFDLWQNDYNDPIPGESFTYPEFKGYFANVRWMNLTTAEGEIRIGVDTPKRYVGVYEPRDGRDKLLYTLPKSGISLLDVIPPVRNKVNATDLIGPSSQPHWANGVYTGRIHLSFQ